MTGMKPTAIGHVFKLARCSMILRCLLFLCFSYLKEIVSMPPFKPDVLDYVPNSVKFKPDSPEFRPDSRKAIKVLPTVKILKGDFTSRTPNTDPPDDFFPLHRDLVTLWEFFDQTKEIKDQEGFLKSLSLGERPKPSDHYKRATLLKELYKFSASTNSAKHIRHGLTPRMQVQAFMANQKKPRVTLDAFIQHLFTRLEQGDQPQVDSKSLPVQTGSRFKLADVKSGEFVNHLKRKYPEETYGRLEGKNFYALEELYQNYITFMAKDAGTSAVMARHTTSLEHSSSFDWRIQEFFERKFLDAISIWTPQNDILGTQDMQIATHALAGKFQSILDSGDRRQNIMKTAAEFVDQDVHNGWYLHQWQISDQEPHQQTLDHTFQQQTVKQKRFQDKFRPFIGVIKTVYRKIQKLIKSTGYVTLTEAGKSPK